MPVVGVEAECSGLPMFFSTEIPTESSPCDDLGVFVELDKSAEEWANIILEKIKSISRTDHRGAVKKAGFDSVTEAKKLLRFYEELTK